MGRILIIADMEDQCAATPRGLELAHKLGLAVDIVAFTYEYMNGLQVSAAEKQTLRKRLLEQRESTIQARIDKFRKPGQEVKFRAVWAKDLHAWITRECSKRSYFAVVKTGRRNESFLRPSLDWQLLRECPAPILIVAEKRWSRARPVLAALHLGSKLPAKRALNHRVLESAVDLADSLGVELEIITAIEIPVLLADMDLVDPDTYTRDAESVLQPHLRELAKAHGIPESAFLIKRGPVERVISSRAAKVGAQIVVMGTAGRKGVKARLLGNTAEKVLQHLKTDVLAIKP